MTESVVVPRLIATAATLGPGEAERLVRSAGLPTVLRGPETARTPSARTYRLWGAVVARTGRQDAGLLAAAGYRPGLLDLFDYLVSTAPTLGEGLARATANIHLVSTNSLITAEKSADEVTICYGVRHGDEELRGVVAEFALGVITSQLRYATGDALSPLRVGFAQRAPRHHSGYADIFGPAPIEFGAAADTITLHRSDLERPLATADPALAAIIQRTIAAIPPPHPVERAAIPGLRELIAARLPDGRPSLAEVARRLGVSPRTLQRRLGESGTTWRAELDAERRVQSAAISLDATDSAQRAARLGFSESRSLRRAMNRWNADQDDAVRSR
jgi:AraC-like DNA-binding protein